MVLARFQWDDLSLLQSMEKKGWITGQLRETNPAPNVKFIRQPEDKQSYFSFKNRGSYSSKMSIK
jgi:hypothetical protein